MAHPQLPPYLGTWEELVQALLRNPLLGSGGGPHPHLERSHTEHMGPQPDPWSPATALFVVAAGLKDIVARMPEGQKSQLGIAIGDAADDWDEWYCGNGPRPRPHVVETIGQLLAFASTLEAGTLRTGIVTQAGALLQKSFSTGEHESGQVRSIA